MSLYIGTLNRGDADAVADLRLREYGNAEEFQLLRPEMLRWSEHDEHGVILGIWAGEQFVSTLRALLVSGRQEAEDVLTCTVDLPVQSYPAIVFGRGATNRNYRRLGLNALQRLYFLRAVIENNKNPLAVKVNSSLALPYEGGPRLRLMEALGYQLKRPAQTWDPEAREIKPALLAMLPQDKFESAERYLANLCSAILHRCPWKGPDISLPIH
jgi:hypothetical protein